jgi:hypothetical protein
MKYMLLGRSISTLNDVLHRSFLISTIPRFSPTLARKEKLLIFSPHRVTTSGSRYALMSMQHSLGEMGRNRKIFH